MSKGVRCRCRTCSCQLLQADHVTYKRCTGCQQYCWLCSKRAEASRNDGPRGALKLLLLIKERIAKTDKSTAEAALIERNAAHALARLLISVDPAHVFSGTISASSAVSALAPLLSQDLDSELRNLLPTFEALSSLTNLASMEDDSIRELELRLIWQQLEDHLLLSSNTLVQRASVELVCNLMASPNCVTKFVGDGSKREGTRMQILLALADVEDLATRRAAGGALAMLTQWDAAVSARCPPPSPTSPTSPAP